MVNYKKNTKAIAVTGVITAAAFLLTFVFRFKVSFLTFDLKDSLIAIISLMYGPLYGLASSLIVAFLEFISVSDTGFYGFIMNFLASGTFALVCGIIYKYKRTFFGAVLGLVFSIISVIFIMILANIFITPFYMGVNRSAVISMILPLLLPFNAAKTIINSSAVLIIYKPITNALKKFKILQNNTQQNSLKGVIITIISVLLIIITFLYLTLKLNGVFQIF